MALTQQQKDNIKANLGSIPIDNIAKCLLDKEFTLKELKETGHFLSSKQNAVEQAIWDIISQREDLNDCNWYITTYPQGKFINQAQNKKDKLNKLEDENNMWNNCLNVNTIEEYNKYISTYPQGKYVIKAKTNIDEIKNIQIKGKVDQIINELKENPNKYTVEALKNNLFTKEKLNEIFPKEVLSTWDEPTPIYDLGESPDDIPQGMTEVYFWGVPGSGKSCALAAILSQAKNAGLYEPIIRRDKKNPDGLNYMYQLSNLFEDKKVAILSDKGTQFETTNYLPFNLRDNQQKKHPLAFIELSGEIFKAITSHNIDKDSSNEHEDTYEKLKSYLRNTKNRKYHFFVIDVTSKEKVQSDYLQTAASFFNEEKIFNEMTAGINILVTKSDLLADEKSDREREAINLLKDKYKSFINTLKEISKDILNTDKIRVIPFSIGKVYLQNRCIFNNEMSMEVIQILQENTIGN